MQTSEGSFVMLLFPLHRMDSGDSMEVSGSHLSSAS
jgi:hypothetical protein